MLSVIKKFFSKKSEEDYRVESFKKIAENNNYKVKAIYKVSNKVALEKDNILIVINILDNNVVTTLGDSKLKRFNLTDDEINQVIIDPKVKIKDKKFTML